MNLGLKGRRALVMGASKGLGRSIADALAAEGAALVISGRDQKSLDVAAKELVALGAASCIGIPCDVAHGAQMDALADWSERYGFGMGAATRSRPAAPKHNAILHDQRGDTGVGAAQGAGAGGQPRGHAQPARVVSGQCCHPARC